LWKSTILVNVAPLSGNSRRMCVVRLDYSSNWKLLLVNVYMPHENHNVSTGEIAQLLSVFEDLNITHSGYNIVMHGGDLNVDFSLTFQSQLTRFYVATCR